MRRACASRSAVPRTRGYEPLCRADASAGPSQSKMLPTGGSPAAKALVPCHSERLPAGRSWGHGCARLDPDSGQRVGQAVSTEQLRIVMADAARQIDLRRPAIVEVMFDAPVAGGHVGLPRVQSSPVAKPRWKCVGLPSEKTSGQLPQVVPVRACLRYSTPAITVVSSVGPRRWWRDKSGPCDDSGQKESRSIASAMNRPPVRPSAESGPATWISLPSLDQEPMRSRHGRRLPRHRPLAHQVERGRGLAAGLDQPAAHHLGRP